MSASSRKVCIFKGNFFGGCFIKNFLISNTGYIEAKELRVQRVMKTFMGKRFRISDICKAVEIKIEAPTKAYVYVEENRKKKKETFSTL